MILLTDSYFWSYLFCMVHVKREKDGSSNSKQNRVVCGLFSDTGNDKVEVK